MKIQALFFSPSKANPSTKYRKGRLQAFSHTRLVIVIAFFLVTLLVGLLSSCDSGGTNGSGDVVPEGNIATIAGLGGDFDYSGDGDVATHARLGYVTGIASDADGNVYVADGAANVIRKINHADGKIETVAGTFLGFNTVDPAPHDGDGTAATKAHLNVPFGIAVAANGDLYIADAGNQVIRRIDAATGKISVFAGSYSQPLVYTGDGGAATSAALHTPHDIAIDNTGNVFIADKDNHAIRRVLAGTSVITTVAGGGPEKKGYAGDNGPAINASLDTPQGIGLAENGDLYIADSGNDVIRRVDAVTGKITTVAGTGTSGYSGDNGPATGAKLSGPTRLAVDHDGNLFIADHGNHVIRKVDASGIISTVAGKGTAGYSGDGGLAVNAELSSPYGVALDKDGNLLITDTDNSVIRMVVR
jgi:streptogramin lyase